MTGSLKRKCTRDWSHVFKDCTSKELKRAEEALAHAKKDLRYAEEKKRIRKSVEDYGAAVSTFVRDVPGLKSITVKVNVGLQSLSPSSEDFDPGKVHPPFQNC